MGGMAPLGNGVRDHSTSVAPLAEPPAGLDERATVWARPFPVRAICGRRSDRDRCPFGHPVGGGSLTPVGAWTPSSIVAAVAGLVLFIVATVAIGVGFAALLLLGLWAGRLTAQCMTMPFRNENRRLPS
jgi:hypothetical protein